MGPPQLVHCIPCGQREQVVLRIGDVSESLGIDFASRGPYLVVQQIKPGSAAESCGLRPPFVLHSIGERPVATEHDLVETVGGMKRAGTLEYPLEIEPCRLGPTTKFTVSLTDASEPVGIMFRDGPGDGTVRVHSTTAAAERAGMPHGEHVVLRSVDGQRVFQASEVGPIVLGIKQSGRLEFPVELDLLIEDDGEGATGAAAQETAVPTMPLFEPAHDPAARLLLEKAKQLDSADETMSRFTFPADTCFWDNFCQQTQLVQDAQEAPVFQVSASHDESRQVFVNQGFLRGFVRGWEEANPHTVVVEGPDGEKTFHASKEFWNDVVERLREAAAGRPPPPVGNQVNIRSNLCNMPPVVSSTQDWNEACQRWEEAKGVAPEQLEQLMALRWAEVSEKKRKGERGSLAQAPRLSRRLSEPVDCAPRSAGAAAAAFQTRRDASTQCATPPDPEPAVFRSPGDPLPPVPPAAQARTSSSSPYCPTCGSPRRSDSGSALWQQPAPAHAPGWVLVVPQGGHCVPQGAASLSSPGAAAPLSAASWDMQAPQVWASAPPPWVHPPWPPPPPHHSQWPAEVSPPTRMPPQPCVAPAQRADPVAERSPFCASAARATRGGVGGWVEFVRGWESVASDIQRESGPSYAHRGGIDMRDI
eukprot:TRINITY_DN32736_c0_g1_i1.p1 TRINITY_DN32736_c0_g1~~TRINITY_DN32736_c0_g1_i1.p1  ORF type:complete len:668 (+),score=139.32 TRINITY_DN32736_c0_g1_i1:68-2005(+)